MDTREDNNKVTPRRAVVTFGGYTRGPNFSISVFRFSLRVAGSSILILLRSSALSEASGDRRIFNHGSIHPRRFACSRLHSLGVNTGFRSRSNGVPCTRLRGSTIPSRLHVLELRSILSCLVSANRRGCVVRVGGDNRLKVGNISVLCGVVGRHKVLRSIVFNSFRRRISRCMSSGCPSFGHDTAVGRILDFCGTTGLGGGGFRTGCITLRVPCGVPFHLTTGLNATGIVGCTRRRNVTIRC